MASPPSSSHDAGNLDEDLLSSFGNPARGTLPPVCLTGKKDKIAAWLDRFDTFLLDCDGVIVSGENMIPGAIDAIQYLWAQGKRVILVTNDSTRSRAAQRLRFERAGLDVAETDIFTSGYSAVVYLSQVVGLGQAARSRVFLIGEAGLEEELARAGLQTVGGADPAFRRDVTDQDFRELASGAALRDDVGAVVVGCDSNPSYLKILHAMQYVRQRDAHFVAPLCDVISPKYGALFPAGGFWALGLASLVGRDPVMTGKPSPAMMDAVRAECRLDLARTCMVGDYMKTDMRFGIDNGVGGTLLVLTGISTAETLKDPAFATSLPDAYIASLGHLKP